jgi:hypothetical protein
MSPSISAIWVAQVLHAIASAIMGLAIAALTLSMCGHDSFSDRLGGNARYASVGSALAAGGFGLASAHLGEQSIFFITAGLALPAIACLFVVKPADQAASGDAATSPSPMSQNAAAWTIYHMPAMHVFAVCIVLFQLSNAALLPLVLGELSQHGENLNFIVPATIIVPQFIVAAASPWAGAMARHIGRRRVLLTGFIALPVRALLFAFDPWPEAVAVIQILDGISATVVGLMLPLIAADLTRKTGHMNLAIGSFGLAAGLGATFSTTVAGWVADHMGGQMAFLGLALVGAMAVALLAVAMPETRSRAEAREAEAEAAAAGA